MKKVFLFHGGVLQHYRIAVYNYLSAFLKEHNYLLIVISEGKEPELSGQKEFPEIIRKFSLSSLIKLSKEQRPWANILFINHRKHYFFPFLFFLRISGGKVITWTHGINLQNRSDLISRLAHHLEHSLCQRIILYSGELKNYLLKNHQKKTFVANNTLNFTAFKAEEQNRKRILRRYGIRTDKNIIYTGRITKRKRIRDLIAAFNLISEERTGLVLVGPDEDRMINQQVTKNPRVFYLGPIYGKDALEILSACDVCCIPGAVGLGIVDAMFCGLPVVTEDVDHGPEIMYFKEGVNGFMVGRGDIISLSERLKMLLDNDDLRKEMGSKAKEEILTNGHIDNLCRGFLECLRSLELDSDN